MTKAQAKAALVTNATGFAGPPAVTALLAAGFQVFAHDESFTDADLWRKFAAGRVGLTPIAAQSPEETVAAVLAQTAHLPVIVSNDHVPAPAYALADAPVSGLRENYSKLVEFPFRLIQAALPALERQGGANIVMITSNRMRLPLKGGAFPDAARAAANALVRSLAVECAKAKVTVNAIAPNFLYSEAFYPKAIFEETEHGRAYVRDQVPAGRLADPEEMGELITFLATARTRHLTGAIIDFSGGWPFGAARPAK